jgi:DNA integrity scanning protein DisA with diadenylate cyclase activity
MESINNAIFNSALELNKNIAAKAIIVYADLIDDISILKKLPVSDSIILVVQHKKVTPEELGGMVLLQLPIVSLSRMGLIKISIMLAISAGYISYDDKVICLSGLEDKGYLDSLFVVDLENESEIIISKESHNITSEVKPEVFTRILSLSVELAKQGRESEPVGTIFVLGDHKNVLKLSRQLIMNPFQGHPESDRQILDPNLRETIKEFSSIDGAFVIREDGILLSAGRYLNTAPELEELLPGLGCRHAAAAGITSLTKAVAIVISQSTGSVRIFKDGKVVMKIEKTVT